MYICQDGDDWAAFCGEDNCLKEDADPGKRVAREEYSKRLEKNSKGRPLTGAEKFRMGTAYISATLAKWIASQNEQQKVSDWMKNSSPFLVALGGTGVGKTYMSAAILNYYFDKKEEIFYTTHRRFIEELHQGIQEGKSQHYVINKYSNKNILIIDDLGATTCTEWQQEMILELIDQRYNNRSKTVITCNLNVDAINEKLGKRTASRILDKNNTLIENWSTDRRQDKGFQWE